MAIKDGDTGQGADASGASSAERDAGTERGVGADRDSDADRDSGEGTGSARDRDQGGRPRNARPRDAYGRPLPRGATGEPVTPDDLELGPVEALAEAQRLLDADRPFHAHEVLEAVWKSAGPGERGLWRGLAQLAVGLTHLRRGNPQGAVSLLRRGADRLAGELTGRPTDEPTDEPTGETAPPAPYGLDLPAVVATARGLAAGIESGEIGPGSPVRLRLSA